MRIPASYSRTLCCVCFGLKSPGREGSWMGDYATCGSCHLAHAARFALAPRLVQRYNRRVSYTN